MVGLALFQNVATYLYQHNDMLRRAEPAVKKNKIVKAKIGLLQIHAGHYKLRKCESGARIVNFF